MPNPWTLQALVHSLLATFVTCTPVETDRTVRPRQNGEGVVSGISWRDANGNAPVRREIRDLKENYPDQWNLYLLGLGSLQWTTQSDALSYYSIASIHGRPFRTWANAPGLDHKIGAAGYCPHGNILFLGWHRPYLALFEEELYKHVQDFASTAPSDQAARYETAAQSFRIPYWDWARGEDAGPVPDFFTTPRIDVIRPDGTHDSLWNPLYSYYFHPLIPDDFNGKWTAINATTRWPSSDAWDATSDQTQMLSAFAKQRRSLHDHVDQAFRESSINEFSNRIEEAHGWVHGVIGGGWTTDSHQGHMWPLEYSAFEPLFMLHHTNVDRLFAMYQSTHPERTFSPQNIANNGNVFLEDGQVVDGDTQLLPFRKPGTSSFWTTNDVTDTRVFGYTYPETGSGHDTGAAVARLYSSSARALLGGTGISASAKHVVAGNHDDNMDAGSYTDWFIHCATTSSLGTFIATFSLSIIFNPGLSGNVSLPIGRWVKIFGDFTWSLPIHKNGTVSLTASLLDRIAAGELASLEHEDVVPYLTERLDWAVLNSLGEPIPYDLRKDWRFEVRSKEARIPVNEESPVEYSDEELSWPACTLGKPSGIPLEEVEEKDDLDGNGDT